MGGRKQKPFVLDGADLMSKSVSEIDSALSSVYAYAAMALSLRQHKAVNEKITTPPPTPPRLLTDGVENIVSAASTVRVNHPRRAPNTLPNKPPKHVTWVAGSTVHTAYSVIDRYPHGVDLPIFREEFDKLYSGGDGSGLHSKALQNLRISGHVLAYKKKLFSYDRLKQFLENVKAGVVEDIPDGQPTLHGKWSVTVYEFIRSHRGEWVEFRDIVEHIMRQPGFENTANAPSQVAVALRNLQYRHHSIEKMRGRGKGQYRISSEE
jgi:hypothetical protein